MGSIQTLLNGLKFEGCNREMVVIYNYYTLS